MADPGRITITGPEFAVLVLHGHTRVAHVDEQTCTEPDCAAVRLLAEHPDDWRSMGVAEMRAWLGHTDG